MGGGICTRWIDFSVERPKRNIISITFTYAGTSEHRKKVVHAQSQIETMEKIAPRLVRNLKTLSYDELN